MLLIIIIVLLICLLLLIYFHHKIVCNELDEIKASIKSISQNDLVGKEIIIPQPIHPEPVLELPTQQLINHEDKIKDKKTNETKPKQVSTNDIKQEFMNIVNETTEEPKINDIVYESSTKEIPIDSDIPIINIPSLNELEQQILNQINQSIFNDNKMNEDRIEVINDDKHELTDSLVVEDKKDNEQSIINDDKDKLSSLSNDYNDFAPKCLLFNNNGLINDVSFSNFKINLQRDEYNRLWEEYEKASRNAHHEFSSKR